jgi:hypothetical protein
MLSRFHTFTLSRFSSASVSSSRARLLSLPRPASANRARRKHLVADPGEPPARHYSGVVLRKFKPLDLSTALMCRPTFRWNKRFVCDEGIAALVMAFCRANFCSSERVITLLDFSVISLPVGYGWRRCPGHRGIYGSRHRENRRENHSGSTRPVESRSADSHARAD